MINDVQEGRKIAVLLVCAVHPAVDCYEAYIGIGEGNLGVVPNLEIISAESAHILDDDGADLSSVHICDQALEVRSVEVRSAPAIVHIELCVSKAIVICVLLQDRFLRQDLSRVVSAKMIFSKNSKCDFVTESASETGYTTNTKHKEAFL